jgi:hypothetical protein
MKKLLTIHVCLFLLISLTIAQAPQALNYQAVARTSDGVIIPTQNIGVRFSILDANVTGTVLFSETHTTTTNPYGLFTLAIGKGTPVTSTFASINWASGTDKFLKVEIAPTGGNNYQLQGTTQLLSVPYALYSEKTRLIAGNNTINIANGNTITANYQAGTGINISGNTISHNLVAGTGINITGNTITNTATNLWVTHANGIYYPASGSLGNVGIRTTPGPAYSFISNGDIPGVIEGNAGLFTSTSTWHTDIAIRNNSTQYTFVVGGSGNTEILPNNFGIYNSTTTRWPLTINGANNNVGIGDPSPFPIAPKSSLHIKQGDVYIEQIASGIIMKSSNGQCWRVTIDNTGNLVRTAITCPN